MKKKTARILTRWAVFLLLVGIVAAAVYWSEFSGPISKRNGKNFAYLLSDLVKVTEEKTPDAARIISNDLAAIRKVNGRDFKTAESIAMLWTRVYLEDNYVLNCHKGEEVAEGLEESGIPDSDKHAIVVLGYELADGAMQPELEGRCRAAAALAKAYPNTILICSGGATGPNNPEGHTEAGLMKEFLTVECGIDPSRIYIDERAMTTQENALNSFVIMQEHGVNTMTIVTSTYHQRWGEVVYNAVATLYANKEGYQVSMISNYCFETDPTVALYLKDAQIAAYQIAGILELKDEDRALMPDPFADYVPQEDVQEQPEEGNPSE